MKNDGKMADYPRAMVEFDHETCATVFEEMALALSEDDARRETYLTFAVLHRLLELEKNQRNADTHVAGERPMKRMDVAFEKYRAANFGACQSYPLEAYTRFCAGWKAATDAVMSEYPNKAAHVIQKLLEN